MRLTESTTLAALIGNEGKLERLFISEVYKVFKIKHDLDLEPIARGSWLEPFPTFTIFVCENGLAAVGRGEPAPGEYPQFIVLSIGEDLQVDKMPFKAPGRRNKVITFVERHFGSIKQIFGDYDAVIDRAENAPTAGPVAIKDFRSKVMARLLPLLKTHTENIMADLSGLASNFLKNHNFQRAAEMAKRLHALKTFHVLIHADKHDSDEWYFIEDHMLEEAVKIPAVKRELKKILDRFGLDDFDEIEIEKVMTGDWSDYEYDEDSLRRPPNVVNSREFFTRYLKTTPELSELVAFIKNRLRKGADDED